MTREPWRPGVEPGLVMVDFFGVALSRACAVYRRELARAGIKCISFGTKISLVSPIYARISWVTVCGVLIVEELDRFDQKILAAMEKDARQTGNQLSEVVGLFPAACLRRLQRLRKIGAIEREVAVVNPVYKRMVFPH